MAIEPRENGFDMNDMYEQMQGHVLAEYTLRGTYSKQLK